MESNKSLPLLVIKNAGIALGRLGAVHFYALALNHDQARVDAFDFGDQLFLRNGACLWLFDKLGRVVVVNMT